MKKDLFNLRLKSKLLLFSLFALLAGGVSPAWAQAIDLPYSYGFENDLLTLEDGWTKVITTSLKSNNDECGIVGAAKKTGSYGFRFSSYNTRGENAQYLISPELNAPTGVTVSFVYAASSSSGTEKFKVGYSTTDAEIASFTFGDEISYSSTSWTTFEQTFPAGTKYVAVYYYANYQYRLYVDDFSFTTPPTCITPTGLSVSEITGSSVQLSWTSNADNFNVQYKKAADADWTDVNGTISNNPYTLGGLESNTAYQARIRTYCDATDQSDWTDAVSFTTDCGTVTVFPFSETFNNITSGIPDCWKNSEGTTNTVNYRWSYHASGHDGACVRFNSYNNNDGLTNFLKTPVMSLPAGKSMQLKFWYKNPTGGDFSVYISNDGGTTYTTELATGLTGVSAWTEYEATIPVGFTENVVIVFKGTSNYGNGDAYIYLDDVEISEAPACPKPTGLTASNATYNSVELAWTAGSDETEWKVIYGAAGFDPASEGTTIDNVTDNPYTLTGLTEQTTYDVYVKAVKGSDVSPVSNKASFTTTERYPAPTGLEISNLTKNSATLTWEAGSASSWEVAINTTGTTPTEAGTVVTTTTYEFTDLTAETDYYAFVREKDGDNYSNWSAACKFTPTAAVDLTIFDGENTNSYLPVTGYSTSYTGYAQFIIPSSALTVVQNGKIKKLTFYSSTDATKTLTNYNVYVKETDDDVFSSSDASNVNGMTNVYSGALSIVGNKMEVVFSEPFEYTNKNLQVAFAQSTKSAASSTWYGVTQTTNVGRYTYGQTKGYVKFLPKTTVNYIAYVSEIPALRVTDPNSQILAESPATYEFGMTETAETAEFTLQNIGNGTLTVKSITATGGYQVKISEGEAATSISSTVIGTNEASPVTLQVIQPTGMSEGAITITTDVDGDNVDEEFVINVSGMVRDTNKEYQAGFTALPSGWTSEGNWSYSAATGAATNAWYINSGTLARLKTPKLTVAAGEKFIVEAKGYSTDNTSYQHLVLQYSTDGTNWTTFSDDLDLDPTDWKKFTVIWPNEAGEYFIALLASQADIRMYYGGEVITGANFAINIAENAQQDFGQKVKVNEVAEKTYTVTNSGNADLTVTFTDATDFYVPKTVKFTKPNSWTGEKLNFYAWDSSNNSLTGVWPGIEVTDAAQNDLGEWIYTVELPKGATGIKYSDNASHETGDISTSEFKYITGLWYDETIHIWQNDGFTVAANGGSASFTVKMDTKTPGAKSGNVVLAFDALNANSFTIPCVGNVLDPNYLIVDFTDGQFPEGWQIGDNWSVTSGYALQSSTTTPTAIVTTPLTVGENETLTFEVARNASGQGYTTSLQTRYSVDGGATWSAYTTHSIDGTGLTEKTLTGVPAGTAIIEFLGCNIKLDNIEGSTKTTAPAIALSEGTAAVANGDTKNFGFLDANGTATYTVTNIGNATLNATINGEGVTVSPATIEVAAGATADITVTMAYGEPYGPKTGKMTIDSDGWVGDFEVNFTAELVDPDALVVDFESGMPAGWYLDTWTVSGGTAHINEGGAKPMITELVGAEDGKNTLTFDAKLQYDYGYGTYTLDVYTSTDRKDWGDPKTFTLTGTSQTFSLDALSNGNYYVKFEAANASIDNIKGVKKLAAPEHDLYLVEATVADAEMMPIDTYTATVKVASLRADEDVTADLYFGETKVATTTQTIASGATATITVEGKAPAAGEYEVKVLVSAGAINFEAGKANVTVADKTELAITNFAPVTKNVQADDNNMFTAEFNVTVKNSGSVAVDAATIGINITDDKDVAYEDVTKSVQTVFLVPGAYTTDNAKLFIYRWSTAEDEEWDEFTKIADNLYSADLNGKDKFIVVRKASDAVSGWDGAYNQSVNLEAANGICFTFDSWGGENNPDNFTAGNEVSLPNNASMKLKVAVTALAGNGGAFEFKAQENVTNNWWSSNYGVTQTVNVTAAPTIVLNENGDGTFATGQNRKVTLNRTFVEGWNTICLPFAIEASDIHENAKALAFTAYNAGTKELTFSPVTELEANKPYVIYVPEAITAPFNFSGKTVSTSADPKTFFDPVIFQGTYAPMAAGSLEGKWGLTAAGKIAKASATTTMKGFRAYFDGIPAGATARFLDDLTGISTITADGVAVEGVYNLQGQKVEQLKKGGLYIINGKKTLVK